jgi:hypothetical protein
MELSYYSPEIRKQTNSRNRAGGKAEAALDVIDGTIDSMTKTAVFFSLQTESLRRNG